MMFHLDSDVKATFVPLRLGTLKSGDHCGSNDKESGDHCGTDVVQEGCTVESIERAGTQLMKNDCFEKYAVTAVVAGELTLCKQAALMQRRTEKRVVKESYSEYLQCLVSRDPRKDQWIYNILDGLCEQESILFQDERCMVFRSFTWTNADVSKLHVLCIPKDKSLRCLRSLTDKDLPLLGHMKDHTLEVLRAQFELGPEQLKLFFHYEPSTYHLHLHAMTTSNREAPSSVEYSHDLDLVMFNLSRLPTYYQDALLNKRV